MSDRAGILDSLYGKSPTPTDGFSMQRTPEEQAPLDALYDGNAAGPPPDEDHLFGGMPLLAGAVDRRRFELLDAGMSEAEFKQIRADVLGVAKRAGLVEDFAVTIADHVISGQLADARHSDAAEPVSDEQIAAWNTAIRAQLRYQYGEKDGAQLLERTQRFVRAHPVLAQALQQRGLGSRPEIVEQLVAHVFSNNIR